MENLVLLHMPICDIYAGLYMCHTKSKGMTLGPYAGFFLGKNFRGGKPMFQEIEGGIGWN